MAVGSRSVLGRLERTDFTREQLQLAYTPCIRPEGIQWTGGLEGHAVNLRLEFENPSHLATSLMPAKVRLAPFGAFVRWRPLTQVTIPSIPPGGRRVITARAELPNRRLSARYRRTREAFFTQRSAVLLQAITSRWPGLRAQIADVAGTPLHLAANIDVRVGHRLPVERHFGRFSCMRPGQSNVAFFKVGDAHHDTYTFDVATRQRGWDLCLAVRDVVANQRELREGVSVGFSNECVCLIVSTPDDAMTGSVAIGVARGSRGQRTAVELELEPTQTQG